MHQLSPLDATFLYLENETTRAHGTLVWLYDAGDMGQSIDRKVLLDHMASRLDVSPIFTHKIHRLPMDYDYPYWVEDESFELLYHVREARLPEPGDWESFCQLVADIHTPALDPNHPLWEMTLVTGLDGINGLPEKCFAILGKFHHVAIDGATGIEIIRRIHDSPDGESPAGMRRRASKKPSNMSSLFRAGVRKLEAFDKARSLLSNRGQDKATEIDDKPTEVEQVEPAKGVPQTLFNQDISEEKVWDCRSFAIDDVKAMRAAVPGATVNDVLLAIVSGGLRHFLLTQSALPDQSMKAGCPINIRTESEASAGGNMISAMIVELHNTIEDPLERLAAITHSTATAKDKISKQGSRKILDMASLVPASAIATIGQVAGAVSKKLSRAVAFNCSVSNLPGPQQPLKLLGAELKQIGAAMPVMPGFGLFVGLCTCAGNLTINMSSAANILPQPQELGDCMEQSFLDLKQATRKQGPKGKKQ